MKKAFSDSTSYVTDWQMGAPLNAILVSLLLGACSDVFHKSNAAESQLALPDKLVQDFSNSPLNSDEMLLKDLRARLDQGDYEGLRLLATQLKSSSLFSNYGDFYEAIALTEIAKSEVDPSKKERFLLDAVDRFDLVASNEYLKTKIRSDLGLTYAALAESYAAKNLPQMAISSYQMAFEAWKSSQFRLLTPYPILEDYLVQCGLLEADWSQYCEEDLRQLLAIYPSNTKEHRAIKKWFPQLTPMTDEMSETPDPTIPPRPSVKDREKVAVERAIDLLIKDKNGILAEQELRRFIKNYPNSTYRNRATYWLAKSLEELGKKTEADKLYRNLSAFPFEYYGVLSLQKLGTSPTSIVSSEIPLAISRDPNLSRSQLDHLSRAESFLKIGLITQAGWELKAFDIQSNFSSSFLIHVAKLQFLAGNHLRAINATILVVTRNDIPNAISRYTLEMMFPNRYRPIIESESMQNQLDPLFVSSLIRQESGFENGLVSWVGAAGLMQLMPATAADIDSNIEQYRLSDPEENIRLGTFYLNNISRNLLDGKLIVGLAGYNAGPHRARQWLNHAEQDVSWGFEEFIEVIPFRETGLYVPLILRNFYWYTFLYSGNVVSDFHSLY